MDFEPIIDGLQVSGIGMGMTSVVLIILALSVRLMAWTDAYLRRREAAAIEASSADEPAAEGIDDDQKPGGAARAAAIAVALALSRRSQKTDTGVQTSVAVNTSNVTSDTWLAEGRARQRAKQGSREWR